jgi:hypothetical protein
LLFFSFQDIDLIFCFAFFLLDYHQGNPDSDQSISEEEEENDISPKENAKEQEVMFNLNFRFVKLA